MSNLEELSHLTFETFQSQGRFGTWPEHADSLQRAYNQAFQFAQNLQGWLLLQGGYGCGKTHLAAAIANFAVSLGVPTLFLTVPDLLDTLRFAYDDPNSTFQERFEQVRSVRLLIMDDFGTQNATQWAQEKLFQIANFRYINHLPTVITTNMPLDLIDGRIRSRLDDPELVTTVRILAPDYRRPTGDQGHPELSTLDLMHNRTFENFDLRKEEEIPAEDLLSLEKAYKTARSYAQKPSGWLILAGGPGCGKTHLAAAIGNYCSEKGSPPLLVVIPDLLDHLRAAFSPNSMTSLDRRFEDVRTASLLILDDLGTQSTTPWAREKLYQLFNYRYNAELPTVITTSVLFSEMDIRLRSRMEDPRLCTTIAITVPAYHGRRTPKKRPPAKPNR